MISIIPRKKVVITRAFRGLWKSQFRSPEILLQQTELTAYFCQRYASERNSESLLLFLFHETEFWVGSLPQNGFGTEFREFASIFVPRYRIPNIFLLCGVVLNGIPRVFCSAEQPEFRRNKPIVRQFRLPRNNFFVGNCQPNVGLAAETVPTAYTSLNMLERYIT